MLDIIKVVLTGIFGILTVVIPLWYKRRIPPKTIEVLTNHSVFGEINEIRTMILPTLKAETDLKTRVLRDYVSILLDTCQFELRALANSACVPASTPSCLTAYLSIMEAIKKEMEKKLPEVFNTKMELANHGTCITMSTKIKALQNQDYSFYQKGEILFDQIELMINLLINNAEQNVKLMNGTINQDLVAFYV